MSREEVNLYNLHVTESEWNEIKKVLPDIKLGNIKGIEVSCKCDVCGKDIPNHSKFFTVMMGHRDWDDDSTEFYDCCTCDCAAKLYEKFEKMKSKTKHIEIECEILQLEGGD